MEDVYVRVVSLPGFCREMVGRADGTTTVLISSDLSDEQKVDALNHALNHIGMGHLDGDVSADVAEAEAHKADASVSPDFAPILRYRPTTEEIPILREIGEKMPCRTPLRQG